VNYYKHYIGDFQRDTTHLSLTARGAYLALMHHYYATEEPLPAEHAACCRIAGAFSKAERDGVKEVMGFFELKDGKLWHKRIEAELEKGEKRSDKNREIALAREARKRAEKDAQADHEGSTKRAHEHGNGGARTEHETCTTDSTIPITIASNTPTTTARAPAIDNEVFAMTAEWLPGPGFTVQAKLAGLPVLDAAAMAEGLNEFRGFWLAKSHELRTQAEWDNALAKSLKTRQVLAASRPQPQAAQRRAGSHAGFQAKDYTAGVNADGSLA